MRRAFQILSVLSATVGAVGQVAAQPSELPAGPNRDLVAHECQACHDLGNLLGAAGLDGDGWSSLIEAMISYGLRVTPDEQAKIVDYLTTYLGPAADTPAK